MERGEGVRTWPPWKFSLTAHQSIDEGSPNMVNFHKFHCGSTDAYKNIYQDRNIRNKILQPVLGAYLIILNSKHFHAYSIAERWALKDTLYSYTFLKRIKRASKRLSLNLILRFWRNGKTYFFFVCRLQLYFRINDIEISWNIPEKICIRMYIVYATSILDKYVSIS